MSGEIMQFDDAMLESELDAMIRTRVEDTANAMPDASGRRDRQRREIRTNRRTQAFRAGRCGRGPRVPEPRGALFESAVIERHRWRGPGVEEALMEMCPAGVSTRRVDGTGRLPWGGRMPSQTPSASTYTNLTLQTNDSGENLEVAGTLKKQNRKKKRRRPSNNAASDNRKRCINDRTT